MPPLDLATSQNLTLTTNNHSPPSARQHNLSTLHHKHDFSLQQLVTITGFGTHTTCLHNRVPLSQTEKTCKFLIRPSHSCHHHRQPLSCWSLCPIYLPSPLSPLSGSRGFLGRSRNHLEFYFFAFTWAIWIVVRESKRPVLGKHHHFTTPSDLPPSSLCG